MIRMKNASAKEIFTFISDTHPDTLLNEQKEYIKNTIGLGANPTIVKVNDSVLKSTIRYGNAKTWKERVKNDTLILYIFDLKAYKATHDLENAKLEMRYITYHDLIKNNCVLSYK